MIRLRRLSGATPPYTSDPIFQQWRFCCVHREHDRTTMWFAENVRGPLDRELKSQRLLESTLIFRWFNLVETGERILDLLLHGWDGPEARRRLEGVSPVVTGAYIVRTPWGMSKLEGVVDMVHNALEIIRREPVFREFDSLRGVWSSLRSLPYMGGFTSYEVVSDLRWTHLLRDAPDICTWANAGPGCARGLGWVVAGDPGRFCHTSERDQLEMLHIMQNLLKLSLGRLDLWPINFHPWEMREVEHWACEFDKWKRAERGDRLKRRFQ